MDNQPHKPETDPRKDGPMDPLKPRTNPGSTPNDPSRRNVSPTEKPERNDGDRQSEPPKDSPPNLQSQESERHTKRGEFQFQANRYTTGIE